ncbi:hypothetical protein SPLC1_S201810 [Arthrospira platensis C1]|nr:hypothetical protein SPLC1_S201810 [Arthrospira platensis C1]
MTMMVEEARREFDRYWERGQYFYEQDNLEQANENFVLGFEQFSKMIYFGYNAESYDDRTKIIAFFSVYKLLDQLYSSFYNKDYTHKTILAYLLINMKKIIEHLSSFKSSFSVENTKNYQEICDSVKIIGLAFTTEFSEELAEELAKVKRLIESTKPDKTSDETLKKLRTSLRTISEISFFPTFEPNGGGCFVATAAYSTSIHPDLDTFRKFRDRTLLTNPWGRVLVSVYYQVGPQLAQFVNRSLYVKNIVRFWLEKLACFIRSHSQV